MVYLAAKLGWEEEQGFLCVQHVSVSEKGLNKKRAWSYQVTM